MDANGPQPAETVDVSPASDSSVVDPSVRRLCAAVDDLTELGSQPVDVHADRYRDVHNLLQDALSDTDRGGPQPA